MEDWTCNIASSGPKVPPFPALGLGCMGMSGMLRPGGSGTEAIAAVHAALDAGITFLDTGDFLRHGGHNELLIRRGAQGHSGAIKVVVSGEVRRAARSRWRLVGLQHGRPQAVKNYLAYSLLAARASIISTSIGHRASIPRHSDRGGTIGAIADMVKAGYVRHIGLSRRPRCARRCGAPHAVHPVSGAADRIFARLSRGIERRGILPTLPRARHRASSAYGVLSGGLISGHWRKGSTGPNDFRTHSPRFQGANVDANLALVDALRRVAAAERGSASHRLRSHGWRHRAVTSFHSWARAAVSALERRSAR